MMGYGCGHAVLGPRLVTPSVHPDLERIGPSFLRSMPRVSVIMPVRNASAYVAEAIHSLRVQTFSDLEIVVVDDGSTDGTSDILRAEASREKRLRVISAGMHLGLPHALNRAIAEARGEWLARHDADDVALPERIEQQLAFLEQHRDVGVVGGHMEEIEPDGRSRGIIQRMPLSQGLAVWTLLYGRVFGHPSVMFRRSILPHPPVYDPAWKDAEDVDLWMRLAGHTRFANLPRVLCRYRVHEGGVSRSQRTQRTDTAWVRRYRFACDLLGRKLPFRLWAGWRDVLAGYRGMKRSDQRRLAAILHELFETLCARGWIPEEDRAEVRGDMEARCAELGFRPQGRGLSRVTNRLQRFLPWPIYHALCVLRSPRREIRRIRLMGLPVRPYAPDPALLPQDFR